MTIQELIDNKENFGLSRSPFPDKYAAIYERLRRGKMPENFGTEDERHPGIYRLYEGTSKITFAHPRKGMYFFVTAAVNNEMIARSNDDDTLIFINNRIAVSEEVFESMLYANLFAPAQYQEESQHNAFITVAKPVVRTLHKTPDQEDVT